MKASADNLCRFITILTVNEDFIHFIFGRIDLEYTVLFDGGLETKML